MFDSPFRSLEKLRDINCVFWKNRIEEKSVLTFENLLATPESLQKYKWCPWDTTSDSWVIFVGGLDTVMYEVSSAE